MHLWPLNDISSKLFIFQIKKLKNMGATGGIFIIPNQEKQDLELRGDEEAVDFFLHEDNNSLLTKYAQLFKGKFYPLF